MAKERFTLAQVVTCKAKPTEDVMLLAGSVVHERARIAFGPADSCTVTAYDDWATFLDGLLDSGMPEAGIETYRAEWPIMGWAVGVIHEWHGTRTVFDDERANVNRIFSVADVH